MGKIEISANKDSIILKFLAALSLVIFVLGEYIFTDRLDALSVYAIYGFEFIFAMVSLIIFRGFAWSMGKPDPLDIVLIALLFPLGILIHFFAFARGIMIPFDLHSGETLLFLLLIGPVLEELIFRGALWSLIGVVTNRNNWVRGIVTTFLFSYGHYQMIGHLPEGVKSFVIYQASYTLVLGAMLAFVRARNGLLWAILGHFCFNFGFWFFSLL
jgi:hypothetical protein